MNRQYDGFTGEGLQTALADADHELYCAMLAEVAEELRLMPWTDDDCEVDPC